MSLAVAEQPEVAHFPPPPVGRDGKAIKRNLSIDSIMARTQPDRKETGNLIDFAARDHYDRLEAAVHELYQGRKELASLKAELAERERVVNETELLLSARERILDDREGLLAGSVADQDTRKLQQALKDLRQALDQANHVIEEKNHALSELRLELERQKQEWSESAPAPMADAGEGVPVTSIEDIRHPSLADQVEFLKEREAFIEESENTLFNKAQELQEWETRLQQQAHDQGPASTP